MFCYKQDYLKIDININQYKVLKNVYRSNVLYKELTGLA